MAVEFSRGRPGAYSIAVLIFLVPAAAVAGGGPANVMVLYNADAPDAAAVAGYYAGQRSIPTAQLCGLSGIDPGMRAVDFEEYETLIQAPFEACLGSLPQPGEIDYIVLVRGLPYKVNIPDGYSTSLSAMIQVHRAYRISTGEQLAGTPQYNGGSYFEPSILNPAYISGRVYPGDFEISNPYQTWYTSATGIVRADSLPESFRCQSAGDAAGYSFSGNLFIVTRLDGFDFQDARDLVDRAVESDGTFPEAEILCMASSDEPRGARDPECEFVARHLAMAGFAADFLSPFDGSLSGHELAAYFTGTANLRGAIAGNTYAAGAVACNLTSFGAVPANFFCSSDGATCPESESQTSIARFVRAGATAVHGTVAEPLNNSLPNAGTLLLYTFGYNQAESFFFNQRFLYWQNIYLGDPLATPYAERPAVVIHADGSVSRYSELLIEASHPDGISSVILYLDGARAAEESGETLTVVVDDPVGTSMDVLAVAVARNASAFREGWSNPDQQPNPDVQGWAATTITVTEPGQEPEPEGIEPLPEGLVEPAPDADADAPFQPDGEGTDLPLEPSVDMGDEDGPGDGHGESGCGCTLAG